MSDDTYSSFLDQANQDTGASKASTTDSKYTQMSTKSVDTDVPASLQKIEADYASEADEPFEPVSLKWDGNNMPSESACQLSWLPLDIEEPQIDVGSDEFGSLVGHEGEISTVEIKEFDPQGQYSQLLKEVEKAGDGKSRIFKVRLGQTRLEYFVVGLDSAKKRIIGMKALAVES